MIMKRMCPKGSDMIHGQVLLPVMILGMLLTGSRFTQSQVFQIFDEEEFAKIIDVNSAVLTTNATVDVWLEGPAWVPDDGGYVLFSAMGGENKIKKLVPPFDLSDFNSPAGNTLYNGNILDAQGRLISAQAGSAGRQIVMVSLEDASFTTLASSSANGLLFLSPNDLVVKSDGTIWFTDPAYNGGVDAGASGHETSRGVYRFHPDDGDGTAVRIRPYIAKRPNGLCFSPDESLLWIADTQTRSIQAFPVMADNTIPIRGGAVATINLPPGAGNPDGIRADVDGRIWSSGARGVHIFSPEGDLIGSIDMGVGSTANLCFGGPDYKTLYVTGQPHLMSIPVLVPGAVSLRAGKTVKLRHEVVSGKLVIAWPVSGGEYVLQETDDLGSVESWANSERIPSVNGDENQVEIEPSENAKFFRLRSN